MRVLVADDQPDVLEAAKLLLKSEGHTTITANSASAVLEEAAGDSFDVLLLDMNYARDTTSGVEGLDLLHGLRASGVTAPVILMTAWGSVDLAVEAMRRGASDFVQKPWDNNRLLQTLDRYGSQARSDIQIARSVQHSLLGRADKRIADLDYAGRCVPIGDIGGDYYDFFDAGRNGLGIALADVSGKGVSAALLMAHLQGGLRSHEDLAGDPARLVESVNRVFWQSSPPEQYATLFYGVYRPGLLRYVNAGHAPAVVLRANGQVEFLDATATPVGMFPKWRGAEVEVRFSAGDKLAIVSDGVLEAGLRADRDFGVDGVLQVLRRCGCSTAMAVAERVLSEAYRHGAEDDMTAVVLNVL